MQHDSLVKTIIFNNYITSDVLQLNQQDLYDEYHSFLCTICHKYHYEINRIDNNILACNNCSQQCNYSIDNGCCYLCNDRCEIRALDTCSICNNYYCSLHLLTCGECNIMTCIDCIHICEKTKCVMCERILPVIIVEDDRQYCYDCDRYCCTDCYMNHEHKTYIVYSTYNDSILPILDKYDDLY